MAQTRTKIILLSLLITCLFVNLAQASADDCENIEPPPIEDYYNSIVYDFPLNETIELDFFNQTERFRWIQYDRLSVFSDYIHDSNVLIIKSNYLNCTYLNVTFSAIHFGLEVYRTGWGEKGELISELFWWVSFNGTNTITHRIRRTIFLDDFNPVLNCTNLNVATEKLPVSLQILLEENEYHWEPPTKTPWRTWGKATVIVLGVVFSLIAIIIWGCIGDEPSKSKKPEPKEELWSDPDDPKTDDKIIIDTESQNQSEKIVLKKILEDFSKEYIRLVKENLHWKETWVDKQKKYAEAGLTPTDTHTETNFCPECGYPIRELRKQKEEHD